MSAVPVFHACTACWDLSCLPWGCIKRSGSRVLWFHGIDYVFGNRDSWSYFFTLFVCIVNHWLLHKCIQLNCLLVCYSCSFALTVLFILPSSIKLLFRPTLWQFKLALVSGVMIVFASDRICIFDHWRSRSVFTVGELLPGVLSVLLPSPWEVHTSSSLVSTLK